MSKRIRLTQRKAADGSIPYPGNVNQPGRTDPDWAQYHTFEQQVNHELPDMRTEWKNDSRDDIGFGIPESNPPTVASVRIAANKAVRIAVLLLGEKVSDSVIEAQARDLMTLSGEAMDRTLDRFAKTQKLYADDDEDDDDEADEAEETVEAKSKKAEEAPAEKEDEKKASAELADKGGAVPPAISLKETEMKAEDKKEEAPAEVKAEDKDEKPVEVKADDDEDDDDDEGEKVEARLAKLEGMIASIAAAVAPKSVKAEDEKKEEKPVEATKKAEDKPAEVKEEEKKAADEAEDKDEAKEAKSKKSEDEAEDDEKEASAHKASPNEMDIELTGSMDEIAADPVADAQLASLFDDATIAAEEEEKDDAEKKAKSKKAGIKKLGGQPKVAATDAAPVDIASIWESAPDVSQLFR